MNVKTPTTMIKQLWHKRDESTQAITKKEKIKLILWRICDFCFFKPTPTFISSWRILLLKIFSAKVGKGCYISPKATILKPWNFEMGNISSIDDYAFIKCDDKIIIGDYVSIGVFVHIISAGHNVRAQNFALNSAPIYIENGAFIGADTYIEKGVTIGQMTVIGARSVVLKNIPENTIAFGFPCQVKSERLSKEEYNKYRYNYVK